MEPDFWNTRWQKQEIAFHQADFHDLMQRYWPGLGLPAGSAVFVPLCGKSLDMVWLARQGHRIVGAELSDIAVDAFFAEQGLEPKATTVGPFEEKVAGPFELWRGDFFDLPLKAVANVAAIYDRASLIAFPPAMQERYANKLCGLSPAATPILLMTFDYDQSQMSGPPFATPVDQVQRLFGDCYDITLLERREALERNPGFRKRGLTALTECALQLVRKK